jgi:molybdopterin-containing oxidoreductase family membrane subunit
MYYIGLSAGGLVVYASVHLFGAKQFAPLARLAVLQAGVLVMMALLGIVTDMERPWRAVWMLLTPNPTSPFIYTGSAANIYMIICFIDLWILITGKGGHKLAHTMTLIALPFAVYLHTTTAFVLVMNKSRELWNTAMLVPIFLTSATASGIALLMICAYIMQKVRVFEFTSSMFRSLATLLATVIIIDLFLLVVEILVIYWPTSSSSANMRSSSSPCSSWASSRFPYSRAGRTGTCRSSSSPPRRFTYSRSSSSATPSWRWVSSSTRSASTRRCTCRVSPRCSSRWGCSVWACSS